MLRRLRRNKMNNARHNLKRLEAIISTSGHGRGCFQTMQRSNGIEYVACLATQLPIAPITALLIESGEFTEVRPVATTLKWCGDSDRS